MFPGTRPREECEDELDAATRDQYGSRGAAQGRAAGSEASNAEANRKKTEEAQKTADLAADAGRTAKGRADRLRESLKDRTTDEQKKRATNYRDALDKRRAARRKLQELHAEVERWLGFNAGAASAAPRSSRADHRSEKADREIPVAHYGPVHLGADVVQSDDGQCRDRRAEVLRIRQGDPRLRRARALRRRRQSARSRPGARACGAVGGTPAPINVSNPDGAPQPQQNQPREGGADPSTATGAPAAGACGRKVSRDAGYARLRAASETSRRHGVVGQRGQDRRGISRGRHRPVHQARRGGALPRRQRSLRAPPREAARGGARGGETDGTVCGISRRRERARCMESLCERAVRLAAGHSNARDGGRETRCDARNGFRETRCDAGRDCGRKGRVQSADLLPGSILDQMDEPKTLHPGARRTREYW